MKIPEKITGVSAGQSPARVIDLESKRKEIKAERTPESVNIDVGSELDVNEAEDLTRMLASQLKGDQSSAIDAQGSGLDEDRINELLKE